MNIDFVYNDNLYENEFWMNAPFCLRSRERRINKHQSYIEGRVKQTASRFEKAPFKVKAELEVLRICTVKDIC